MPDIGGGSDDWCAGRPSAIFLRLFGPNDLDTIASEGEASGGDCRPSSSFAEGSLRRLRDRRREAIASLRRPVLVMHSPAGSGGRHRPRVAHLRRVQAPKSFISLDNADHLLTDVADANYAAAMVAVGRALSPTTSADLPQVEVAEGVVSTETLAGTFQLKGPQRRAQLCSPTSQHRSVASGPTISYELVSAGLAACTVMTMRLYANRKGFPLERASTTVQHEKVPDMMPPDRFTRTIVPRWAAGDDQRARILAIADRCPVDLSLIRGSDVQTELLSASQAADPARLA